MICSLTKIICYIFSASGFNQFGLYHDDCLYENDDVKEALRRLPGVGVHGIQLIIRKFLPYVDKK